MYVKYEIPCEPDSSLISLPDLDLLHKVCHSLTKHHQWLIYSPMLHQGLGMVISKDMEEIRWLSSMISCTFHIKSQLALYCISQIHVPLGWCKLPQKHGIKFVLGKNSFILLCLMDCLSDLDVLGQMICWEIWISCAVMWWWMVEWPVQSVVRMGHQSILSWQQKVTAGEDWGCVGQWCID